MGVCAGATWDWRLSALRRGRRILREGVPSVVVPVGVLAVEGGVEGMVMVAEIDVGV